MLKIYLIRHGQTPGNKLKRYIGTTDEQLSQEGRNFREMTTIRSGSIVTECFLSREERVEKTLSTEA